MLPEVEDPRTQEARSNLESAGLCEVVWVEDPSTHAAKDKVIHHILERRKHKGITQEQAARLARNPLYFGASLVALGAADGSVAGAVNTTADVIRSGIHCVGMVTGTSTVSSMFLLVRGKTAYSYADCGVVPDPSANMAGVVLSNAGKLTVGVK